MIARKELERDKQDILDQLNRLQGALAYVNQKIVALDKLKEKKKSSEAEMNVSTRKESSNG